MQHMRCICIKFHHSPLKFNAKDGIFCLFIRLILDVADHKNISFTKNTSKNTKNINEIKNCIVLKIEK